MLRTFATHGFFFVAGLLAGVFYIYQLHPQLSPEADIKRVRTDIEAALGQGQKLRRAWDEAGGKPEKPAKPKPAKPAPPPAEGPPPKKDSVER